MQIQPHTFRPADLVGGHVVLDLVNTVTARNADPIDWLDSYARALEWAALTGHFDRRVLARLEQVRTAEPAAGRRALRRLRDLRETVRGVLEPTIRNDAVPEQALHRFEGLWKAAASRTRLAFPDGRARLERDVESSRLDYLAEELALCALELLQTFPPARTRICAGTSCGWIFIDRSRGGRRRWCDMATCGNAAKSRRHYERKHPWTKRPSRRS